MDLFGRFRKEGPRRAVVIGLDGTPYSLVRKQVAEGRMPNLAGLIEGGSLLEMESVLPTVSSVAWASIVTGCNPGKHNLFGFIDRVPATHEMFIPNARHLRARTWVERISGMGKRVFSMGVPSTFPPKAVNGVLISGFLAPSLKNATYPLQVARELEEMGYLIDIDAWQAREDREKFLDEVFLALEKRWEALFRFLSRGPWDLFVAHIMDTDRLHHFLWGDIEDGHKGYEAWFNRFYAHVDAALGELIKRIDDETVLMILSDHGFCKLKQEVHLNYWLRQAGFLNFASREPKQLLDLAESTRCYSLLPGRFYVCVKGRERNGCVNPGAEYESVRQDLATGLMEIRDPETGDRVIEKVLMREEVFEGPSFDVAPDLMAMPAKGYDLKGGFEKEVLLERSPVNGTHTFDDAMCYVNQPGLEKKWMTVMDVMPTLFYLMGIDIPEGIDGQAVQGAGTV